MQSIMNIDIVQKLKMPDHKKMLGKLASTQLPSEIENLTLEGK